MTATVPVEVSSGFNYDAQPKVDLDACPLCTFGGFVVISQHDRYGLPQAACCCAQCGLVFLNPRMTPEAYTAFYAGMYRSLIEASEGKPRDEDRFRKIQGQYADRLIRLLTPLLERGGELLDVGGGNGVVARAVGSAFDMRPTIVDPSPEVLEAYGCERIMMPFEAFESLRRYDLITICQTIDHVQDLRGTLALARDLLKPGGALYVDIVDFIADARINGNVRSAIKVDHVYGLTDMTMFPALQLSGLQPIRMVYDPDARHIGYVCRAFDVSKSVPVKLNDGGSTLTAIREIQTRPRKERA